MSNITFAFQDKKWEALLKKEHVACVQKGSYHFRHLAPLGFVFITILALVAISCYGVAVDGLAKHTSAWSGLGGPGLAVALILALVEGTVMVNMKRKHDVGKRERIALESIKNTDAELTQRLAIEDNAELKKNIIASLSKEDLLLQLEYLREFIQEEPTSDSQLQYHSLLVDIYHQLRASELTVEESSLYFRIAKEQMMELEKNLISYPELPSKYQEIKMDVHSHIVFFLKKAEWSLIQNLLVEPTIQFSHAEYISLMKEWLPAHQQNAQAMNLLLATISQKALELRESSEAASIEDREAYKTLYLNYIKYLSLEDFCSLIESFDETRKEEFINELMQNVDNLLQMPKEMAEMVYRKASPQQLVSFIQKFSQDQRKELDFIEKNVLPLFSSHTINEMLSLAIQGDNLFSALLVGKLLHRYINRDIKRGKKRNTLSIMKEYFFKVPEDYKDACLGMLLKNVHLRKRLDFDESDEQITVDQLREVLEKKSRRSGQSRDQENRESTLEEPKKEKKRWFSRAFQRSKTSVV